MSARPSPSTSWSGWRVAAPRTGVARGLANAAASTTQIAATPAAGWRGIGTTIGLLEGRVGEARVYPSPVREASAGQPLTAAAIKTGIRFRKCQRAWQRDWVKRQKFGEF